MCRIHGKRGAAETNEEGRHFGTSGHFTADGYFFSGRGYTANGFGDEAHHRWMAVITVARNVGIGAVGCKRVLHEVIRPEGEEVEERQQV